MASRIEGYDEKIIGCSLKEFLEKGYNDASLRNIARTAGVSTSTIYTRFKDKEGLFTYLISPVFQLPIAMEEILKNYFSMSISEQKEEYDNAGNTGYARAIDMIYEDYHAYKLLVSCSPGDTYKDYLEKITEMDLKYTMLFLKEMNSSALKKGIINEEFCRVVSTAFYSAVFHCVESDMTKEEATKYIGELRNFYGRGWAAYY
ncbi:MAG: TetR/AcrR family transcriptional regulator [Lachnospiraceae bacterium]|nr:TetR/AcrR family transcriptional regulator [Lachnospiraceae bacterium]